MAERSGNGCRHMYTFRNLTTKTAKLFLLNDLRQIFNNSQSLSGHLRFADGDPERFAQLFDVVSRYAERQQNILAGKATPVATPSAPTPQVLPASPSTGSRVSWEEELWQLWNFAALLLVYCVKFLVTGYMLEMWFWNGLGIRIRFVSHVSCHNISGIYIDPHFSDKKIREPCS